MKKSSLLIVLVILLVIAAALLYFFRISLFMPLNQFDPEEAYRHLESQMELGARNPGSLGHQQVILLIREELEKNSWSVELQEGIYAGQEITNIIGKKGPKGKPIVFGAHFDTRMVADKDQDPGKAILAVPGANDGASGVAVLLELSRVLDVRTTPVWLVFFDGEDQGNLPGWDWILGSRYFVEELTIHPSAVIIIDMIGDRQLSIFKERNSDSGIMNEIWEVADQNGFQEIFIPEYKFSMLDDHTPFIEAGIPAIDIIDFDYPYYHTSDDTIDKTSRQSLGTVGMVLEKWFESK